MRKGWLIQFLAYVAWIHVCYAGECHGKYEEGLAGYIFKIKDEYKVICQGKDTLWMTVLEIPKQEKSLDADDFKLRILPDAANTFQFIVAYPYKGTIRIDTNKVSDACTPLNLKKSALTTATSFDEMEIYCGKDDWAKDCDNACQRGSMKLTDMCYFARPASFNITAIDQQCSVDASSKRCMYDSGTEKIRVLEVKDRKILSIHGPRAVGEKEGRIYTIEADLEQKCVMDLNNPEIEKLPEKDAQLLSFFPSLASYGEENAHNLESLLEKLAGDEIKSCVDEKAMTVLQGKPLSSYDVYLKSGFLPDEDGKFNGTGHKCETEEELMTMKIGSITTCVVAGFLTICFMSACSCVHRAKTNFTKEGKPLPKLPWQKGFADQSQQTMGLGGGNSVYGSTMTTVGDSTMGSTMSTVGSTMDSTCSTYTEGSTMGTTYTEGSTMGTTYTEGSTMGTTEVSTVTDVQSVQETPPATPNKKKKK